MKVVEIREEAQLAGLRSAWEALLRDSASDTIFLSWEWTTAWWRAYGKPDELRILMALDENGVLRGIAPLRSRTIRQYGQTVSALTFLSDGSNDSDYLDFIATRGFEREVMEAFRAHWTGELDRGSVLMFNELPEASPNLPFVKTMGGSSEFFWRESDVPCGTVRLPETWEEYLTILKPRFRTKVRSVMRNLENRAEVHFGFCETEEQVERLLPILFDLHTQRWAQESKPGVFRWPQKRTFYAALSRQLLERGWLRFSWLKWKGQVLACQYGFTYNQTYSQLQEGYEPAAEHWNVGVGLRAWSIRHFLSQGGREYDFLGGMGRHKADWGAETKRSKRILWAKPGARNLVFCRGPEWETRARDFAAGILPEKMLAGRRQAMEQKRIAAFHPARNGDAAEAPSGWMLKAAAECYVHSPLPGLLRPFRERYQVTIRHDRGPRISWERRTECAARIFCYHRVNNERDPFFPATTTEPFEQVMRFLARTHKVVSLPALMDHLESGSPGTMLAITFDDGYQDNYHNAFPILQRYGLPATVFLTTGSLDSREPLWFELLAQALKTTAQEYIDTEIDIPRRFWLRSEAERLQVHGRIFGLLRALPDAQRRESLAQILAKIGSSGDSVLRDRMLTWDQVRHMKKHGIEFGGHTVTHPFVSKVSADRLRGELSGCKQRIEAELQAPVEYFAYPNGQPDDFTEDVKTAVRAAGYRAALTTIWGLNSPASDRLEMRRGGPWETDAAVFATKLDWYQLVNG